MITLKGVGTALKWLVALFSVIIEIIDTWEGFPSRMDE